MRSSAQRILYEEDAKLAAICAEGHERPPMDVLASRPLTVSLLKNAVMAMECVAACEHRTTRMLDRSGGGVEDDHCVDYLACNTCGKGLVVTSWATRREVDIRPMTLGEQLRYGV